MASNLGLSHAIAKVCNYMNFKKRCSITKGFIISQFINFEKDSDIPLKWFRKNFLKTNSEKYHLLLSTDKNYALRVGEFTIINRKCEKLLGKKLITSCVLRIMSNHYVKKPVKNFLVVWSFSFPQKSFY